MNNEVVGISAELAIADVFDLYVIPRYWRISSTQQ